MCFAKLFIHCLSFSTKNQNQFCCSGGTELTAQMNLVLLSEGVQPCAGVQTLLYFAGAILFNCLFLNSFTLIPVHLAVRRCLQHLPTRRWRRVAPIPAGLSSVQVPWIIGCQHMIRSLTRPDAIWHVVRTPHPPKVLVNTTILFLIDDRRTISPSLHANLMHHEHWKRSLRDTSFLDSQLP